MSAARLGRLGRSANILQEQEEEENCVLEAFITTLLACLLDGDGAGANNRSDSSKITFVERSALDCAQYSTSRLEVEGSI